MAFFIYPRETVNIFGQHREEETIKANVKSKSGQTKFTHPNVVFRIENELFAEMIHVLLSAYSQVFTF
jgi:hypothetical protein